MYVQIFQTASRHTASNQSLMLDHASCVTSCIFVAFCICAIYHHIPICAMFKCMINADAECRDKMATGALELEFFRKKMNFRSLPFFVNFSDFITGAFLLFLPKNFRKFFRGETLLATLTLLTGSSARLTRTQLQHTSMTP